MEGFFKAHASNNVSLFLFVTFTNKICLPVNYLEVLYLEKALSFLPHSFNLVFKIIFRGGFCVVFFVFVFGRVGEGYVGSA